MKKIVAVLAALALALTCVISVNAIDTVLGNGSGQLTPIFDDFDPSALNEMISGLDFSGLLNDLGMGDITGLIGGLDLTNLLGTLDLSKLGDLGNIGDLFSGLNLEDLLAGIIPSDDSATPTAAPTDPSTTAAPDTTTAPPASTTAPPASTTAAPTTSATPNIPKTGDAGVGVVVALCAAAGAAFVFTRKKREA